MTKHDEEGVVYVTAAGPYYTAPEIDADTLYDALQNGYVQEQVDKASAKIFNGMYRLTVRDPKGEEDRETTACLKKMVEAPGNEMWARMKQAWTDIWSWGACIIYPRWQRVGGEKVLVELRRLDPYTFRQAPSGATETYSDLLPGITLNEAGEMEFHQMQSELELDPVKLKPGVVLFKDPVSTKLAGSSKGVYLVPVVKMLDFCWDAQMQKINRVGAPIMFIRVKKPNTQEDLDYAQLILNNWGKGKSYHLRDNMELEALDVTDNEHALNTINRLEQRIEAPFRAASTLDKEGDTLGGNAAAQKESEDDWIAGQRIMIEDLFEGLLQTYLSSNGYDGYTIEVQIAVKKQNPGYLEARQAEVGYNIGCTTINEEREKLGLPPLDEKGITDLLNERAKVREVVGGPSTGAAVMPFAFVEGDHVPDSDERQLAKQLKTAGDNALDRIVAGL